MARCRVVLDPLSSTPAPVTPAHRYLNTRLNLCCELAEFLCYVGGIFADSDLRHAVSLLPELQPDLERPVFLRLGNADGFELRVYPPARRGALMRRAGAARDVESSMRNPVYPSQNSINVPLNRFCDELRMSQRRHMLCARDHLISTPGDVVSKDLRDASVGSRCFLPAHNERRKCQPLKILERSRVVQVRMESKDGAPGRGPKAFL